MAWRAGQLFGKSLHWHKTFWDNPDRGRALLLSTALPSSLFARLVSQPANGDQDGLLTCLIFSCTERERGISSGSFKKGLL